MPHLGNLWFIMVFFLLKTLILTFSGDMPKLILKILLTNFLKLFDKAYFIQSNNIYNVST